MPLSVKSQSNGCDTSDIESSEVSLQFVEMDVANRMWLFPAVPRVGVVLE